MTYYIVIKLSKKFYFYFTKEFMSHAKYVYFAKFPLSQIFLLLTVPRNFRSEGRGSNRVIPKIMKINTDFKEVKNTVSISAYELTLALNFKF